MIKNIIFDCSDTILRFTALDELTKVVGDANRAADIKAAIHSSRAWNLYDKGEMSEAGLREEILPLFGKEDRACARWYLDNWLKCYTPIPGMAELISDIKKKGWPLYILSDFPPCFDVLRERFGDILAPFDGLAVSYECHATKSDLGLFRYIMKKHDLSPDDCIFIDDVPRLVENARSLGFHGIIFEGAEKLRRALKDIEIL